MSYETLLGELTEGLRSAGRQNFSAADSDEAMKNIAKPIARAIYDGVDFSVKGSATVAQINAMQGMEPGDAWAVKDNGIISNPDGSTVAVTAGDIVRWNGEKWSIFLHIDLTGYVTDEELAAAIAALASTIPQSSSATPSMNGVASSGSSTSWSRGDHVHPVDTSRQSVANMDSTVPTTPVAGHYLSTAAVKTYVDYSVSTNTANHLGTLSLTDLGVTYDDDPDTLDIAITAALNNYTWPVGVSPTNNDYVYVEVDNPQTPTGVDDRVERFKYSDVLASWGYEYTLNNSSFNPDELAALESGITSGLVTAYSGHIADTGIHVTANDKSTWNGKQDAISDLSDIRSGAAAGATALQPSGNGKNVTSTVSSESNYTNPGSTATKLSVLFGKIFYFIGRLVTSWQSTPDNTHFPSEKLVKDSLDGKASSSHSHGSVTNDGKIGSTSGYSVYTTTGGALTAGSLSVSSPSASGNSLSFIDTISQDAKGKITATKKTVTNMGKATADAAGTAGLVPAPAAGKQGSFLRGDATWATPSNNKVTCTSKTDNVNYKLMACATSSPTSGSTYGSVYDASVTLNPSTHTIAANVSGRAGGLSNTSVIGSPSVPVYFGTDGNPIKCSTTDGGVKVGVPATDENITHYIVNGSSSAALDLKLSCIPIGKAIAIHMRNGTTYTINIYNDLGSNIKLYHGRNEYSLNAGLRVPINGGSHGSAYTSWLVRTNFSTCYVIWGY